MNPLKEIEKLKKEISELNDEINSWEDKPSPYEDYEEMSDAIYKFCFDCPGRDSSKCILCYLNKWKTGV